MKTESVETEAMELVNGKKVALEIKGLKHYKEIKKADRVS